MGRIVIDVDGKITIPPEILQRRGLRAGDELELEEGPGSFLLYQAGLDAETRAWANEWWNSMTEEEKQAARQEAAWYESLSEKEKDELWNEFPVSIEEEDEGDEIDITTFQPASR
jgi:bifunctional DNA-binding transcriptional regulator/antitoxin component of YhaV-PrlF toxin-antitoxin module